MLNAQDSSHLEQVRQQTRSVLAAALGGVRDIAVLDAPNQRNVGDSLIWAGELAYFRSLGLRIRYVADLKGFSAADLRACMPQGVVLLHGGGNFGDLWLGHQQYRERVVRELLDYRIVQLPQSVYFASEERAAEANRLLAQHPDLTVLLRDQPSLRRAAQQLPDLDAVYCPDMALGWSPPPTRQRAGRSQQNHDGQDRDGQRSGVLVIARRDLERSSTLSEVGVEPIAGRAVDVRDWKTQGVDEVLWRGLRRVIRYLVLAARVGRRVPGTGVTKGVQHLVRWSLTLLNAINIRSAVRLYSDAELVVVDRLHAHVLAALLGVDHVVLDNSYGKVSAIYEEVSGAFSTAHYATTTDEALATASSLLSR